MAYGIPDAYKPVWFGTAVRYPNGGVQTLSVKVATRREAAGRFARMIKPHGGKLIEPVREVDMNDAYAVAQYIGEQR